MLCPLGLSAPAQMIAFWLYRQNYSQSVKMDAPVPILQLKLSNSGPGPYLGVRPLSGTYCHGFKY